MQLTLILFTTALFDHCYHFYHSLSFGKFNGFFIRFYSFECGENTESYGYFPKILRKSKENLNSKMSFFKDGKRMSSENFSPSPQMQQKNL
jgi:hypothetical protein